ncbi:hypothetical protein AB5I41_28205 [Sphingomonas sp. MMS24-JH45]
MAQFLIAIHALVAMLFAGVALAAARSARPVASRPPLVSRARADGAVGAGSRGHRRARRRDPCRRGDARLLPG